mmetsp:Transcript_13850/g.22879  ORF Transcript_13850/g.22879 Transcript_13850/m.22879 type:complete len:227 (-) Transcript_13850:1067-1747(-)
MDTWVNFMLGRVALRISSPLSALSHTTTESPDGVSPATTHSGRPCTRASSRSVTLRRSGVSTTSPFFSGGVVRLKPLGSADMNCCHTICPWSECRAKSLLLFVRAIINLLNPNRSLVRGGGACLSRLEEKGRTRAPTSSLTRLMRVLTSSIVSTISVVLTVLRSDSTNDWLRDEDGESVSASSAVTGRGGNSAKRACSTEPRASSRTQWPSPIMTAESSSLTSRSL